jgi:hypothetical protein
MTAKQFYLGHPLGRTLALSRGWLWRFTKQIVRDFFCDLEGRAFGERDGCAGLETRTTAGRETGGTVFLRVIECGSVTGWATVSKQPIGTNE